MKVKAIGFFASILCTLHCIATPVLASALPTLIPIREENHIFISVAGFLLTYSLLGFILIRDNRNHKSMQPMYYIGAAMVLQVFIMFLGHVSIMLELIHIPLIAMSLIQNHKAHHQAQKSASIRQLPNCC